MLMKLFFLVLRVTEENIQAKSSQLGTEKLNAIAEYVRRNFSYKPEQSNVLH